LWSVRPEGSTGTRQCVADHLQAGKQKGFLRKCRQMDAKHANRSRLMQLTEIAFGCAFNMVNAIMVGFLDKVYVNSPAYELR
jgi:hypothetical protein